MIIASAFLLLVSFTMLVLGLFAILIARGTQIGFSRCGKCKYNLTGFQGNRCPECGSLLSEVGILPAYENWNTSLVLLGVFFILFGLLIFGLLMAGVMYLFSG